MRRISRLFRVLRGPWGTSRFGTLIQDARKKLIRLLEDGQGEDLIQMYMCGCARDRGKIEIDAGDVLAALREKAGVACWKKKPRQLFNHQFYRGEPALPT